MKKISLLLFALFVINTGFSQTVSSEKPVASNEFKHALGGAAGFTTGYGLSYRYDFGKYMLQATFAPYKADRKTRISAGLAFMFRLVDDKKTSLFLYQANHYMYYKYRTYSYNGPSETKLEEYVNSGIGIGYEIRWDRVSVNFMTGYAAYRNFSNFNMTGEFAIFYRF
jgi:hypothetical protein